MSEPDRHILVVALPGVDVIVQWIRADGSIEHEVTYRRPERRGTGGEMSDYTKAPFAQTPDGRTFEYRLVCSMLERRDIASAYWGEVTGEEFRRMTPAELRVVADVLERAKEGK